MKQLRKKGGVLALALALAVAFPGWALAAAPGASPVAGNARAASARAPQGYVPGEVIVKYRSGVTAASLARAKSRLGVATKRALGRARGVEVLRVTGAAGVEATVAALRRSGIVEYAEPNYIWRIAAVAPNDPRFTDLWGLNNSANPGIDVGALAAWDVTQGDPTVIVGVTDTGIDIQHPDLQNNIWVNAAESNGQPNVDDDGNGYVDDVNGWDFHGNDNTVYDPFTDRDEQHGTHVAGTIAAEANNGVGIAGVAPKVKIMPLKVCYHGLWCDNAAAVDAIYYAINMGVRVINASWGGPTFSQALYEAIAAFGQAGGVFVAAAGNDGNNNDTAPSYRRATTCRTSSRWRRWMAAVTWPPSPTTG